MPFPFYIPSAYYYRDRFRIGATIYLGGYYNPLGYYDYDRGYSDRYYSDRYYSDRYSSDRYSDSYSSSRSGSRAVLRGVVESVDERGGTFVVRNDATGSFVTVAIRASGDVRAGDHVEVSGDWSRSGIFQAYDLDFTDDVR